MSYQMLSIFHCECGVVCVMGILIKRYPSPHIIHYPITMVEAHKLLDGEWYEYIRYPIHNTN